MLPKNKNIGYSKSFVKDQLRFYLKEPTATKIEVFEKAIEAHYLETKSRAYKLSQLDSNTGSDQLIVLSADKDCGDYYQFMIGWKVAWIPKDVVQALGGYYNISTHLMNEANKTILDLLKFTDRFEKFTPERRLQLEEYAEKSTYTND